MNELDRKIQAALRRNPSDDLPPSEPNLAEEVLTVFRGRHRWLSALTVGLNVVFFAGAIWAGVRFAGAAELTAQLQWGALGFVFLLLMMFLKLWFWLEMHTNRVLRELKRVELLLVARSPASPARDVQD